MNSIIAKLISYADMSMKQKDRNCCTCSNNISPGDQLKQPFSPSIVKDETTGPTTNKNNTGGFCLVDDYVHLPSSSSEDNTHNNYSFKNQNHNDNNDQLYSSFQEIDVGSRNNDDDENEYHHAGFLDLVQHTSTLVALGEGGYSSWESSLCHSCVERYDF